MIKKILFNYLKKIWLDSAFLNNDIIRSYIDTAQHVKVLDLGCDDGKYLKKRVKGKVFQAQLYGVDIDIKKLKSAKKQGIIPIKANIEKKLPFKGNFFDIVFANQIIEHIVSTDNFIKEIYRILKPDGYVILATENLASWHNIAALIVGWHPFSLHASSFKNIGNPLRLGNYFISEKTGTHIKVFTLRSLLELINLYGFALEKSFGAGYYPFSGFLSKIFSRIDPNHAAFIGLKARKIITQN